MRAGVSVTALLVLGSCLRPSATEERLVVFAAASLREPFTAVAAELERTRPGLEVVPNFAGTQELRAQLEHGAEVDIFASADARHLDALARSGHVERPEVFAENRLVVVVAREAAETLREFVDLPKARRIVVGAPEVPVGAYTERLLDRAGAHLGAEFRAQVTAAIASRELNVRQVLAKVSLGEADAGFVYLTDARTNPELRSLAIPPELTVAAEYPIARVVGRPRRDLADAFFAALRGPTGQAALRAAGFLPPGAQ